MTKFRIINIISILLFVIGIIAIKFGEFPLYPLFLIAFTYSLLIFWGVSQIKLNFFLSSINYSKLNKNEIAITFDDSPNPKLTPVILDVLKKNNITAAFFCIGKNIDKYPEVLKKIYDSGHIIGNHSYSHTVAFDFFSMNKMKADISKTSDLIESIIEKRPVYFRPPFGITNPTIAKAIKQLNLKSIGWSLRTFDTSKSAKKVISKIKKNLKPGDIILLHEVNEGIEEILDFIYTYAGKKGMKIVSLEELINTKAYEK